MALQWLARGEVGEPGQWGQYHQAVSAAPPAPSPADRLRWGPTSSLALLTCVLVACSQKPPPDYAPDPGLVAEIAELRMVTRPQQACPGETIEAEYEAVLGDGRVIPFARKYDKDRPPALHVMFLRLSSPEADAESDGDWDTDPDPLASAMEGFRLRAELLARPSLGISAVVAPEYSCLSHAFRFEGRRGARGQPGFPGPDVLVRVDILSSPFYERLLVASIEVGQAPPFYALYDADAVPPSDWLVLESRGGRGGRGVDGATGAEGAAGTAGCPGGVGGAGGAGGNGGAGGPGGPGGHVTVMAPSEQPYLAGIVDARSPGGLGGKGGRAGKPGPGGAGGKGTTSGGRRCADGDPGPPGQEGKAGAEGSRGSPGPRARVITVSAADVFARPVPPSLQALLDYARHRD
ncbi:MAG: hypothetical protein GTN62_14940 [Gemmatimonadales bacterium]|nr:hypothetical protein [Gemmatimonadales bacterium]NIN13382.1 hypothetical protein [Gemmatimonadales bacterium]NIN51385.1 hypothetical protein [Gemmatimonadales bacterium]NIP08849.1 hypothetical protein [Gemmatimonadales bacterium]NIQ99843.1 hypothetical protein [Gemmatimonadales bacterium]